MWLSRIHRNGIDAIEAEKSDIDQYCLFTVNVVDDVKIAFKADNGMWLSRINRGSIDAIEAAKSEIDQFCFFTVRNLS